MKSEEYKEPLSNRLLHNFLSLQAMIKHASIYDLDHSKSNMLLIHS